MIEQLNVNSFFLYLTIVMLNIALSNTDNQGMLRSGSYLDGRLKKRRILRKVWWLISIIIYLLKPKIPPLLVLVKAGRPFLLEFCVLRVALVFPGEASRVVAKGASGAGTDSSASRK